MCLCLCFLGDGDGGLLILCFDEVLGGGGGDRDGDRARLFLSLRSLTGDLRDDRDENEGEGVLRILGGEGVIGFRFLCGDRDLRLLRGDRLRDLKSKPIT